MSLVPLTQNAVDKSDAPRTAGEKNFDWKVYGGIGWGANVAISIAALWGADRTMAGKKFLDSTAKVIADIAKVDSTKARTQLRYTSLLTGGFAVLIPIKLLEDRKIDMVKKYDAEHYAAIPNAEEILAPAYERLESEPKQSWSSILASRGLAMVPFYALTSVGMKKGQWLANVTGDKVYVEKLITQAARKIDDVAHINNPSARAEIAARNTLYPDKTVNNIATGDLERPLTAFADYTITEATTSSIVAAFVYLFKNVTAPILGVKEEASESPTSTVLAKDLSQYRLLEPAAYERKV